MIIGGARSGKSTHALRLAEESHLPVSLIATARAGDAEMSERIRRHREDRPAEWKTVEEPLDLASALDVEARPGRCVVIDCLTLWLTNCLLEDGIEHAEAAATCPAPTCERRVAAFLGSLAKAEGEVLLVSNEIGLGLVPAVALCRRFRDEQGRLNQAVAAACDQVTLLVAGLAWPLKSRAGAVA